MIPHGMDDFVADKDAEIARLQGEVEEWKNKYKTLNRELMCELRDPNGTIWEVAKKYQDDLDKAKALLSEWFKGGMVTN